MKNQRLKQQGQWNWKQNQYNTSLDVIEDKESDSGEDEDRYSLLSYNSVLNYYEDSSTPPPGPSVSPTTHPKDDIPTTTTKSEEQTSTSSSCSQRQTMALRNPIISVQINGPGRMAKTQHSSQYRPARMRPKAAVSYPTSSRQTIEQFYCDSETGNTTGRSANEENFTRGMGFTSLEELQDIFPPPLLSMPSSTPIPFIPPIQSINDTSPPHTAHRAVKSHLSGESDRGYSQKTPNPTEWIPSGISELEHSMYNEDDPDIAEAKFYYKYYTRGQITDREAKKLGYKPHATPTVSRVDEDTGCRSKPPPRWKSASKLRDTAFHLAELSLHYRSSTACALESDSRIKSSTIRSASVGLPPPTCSSTIPSTNKRYGNRDTSVRPNTTMESHKQIRKLMALKDDETLSVLADVNRKTRGKSAPNLKNNKPIPLKNNYTFNVSNNTSQYSEPIILKSSNDFHEKGYRPETFFQPSSSNRLLNFRSIDECHVDMRFGNSRSTSSAASKQSKSAYDGRVGPSTPMMSFKDDAIEVGKSSEETLAAKHFELRNQLLRKQMEVYVQWKVAEQCKERYNLACHERSSTRASDIIHGMDSGRNTSMMTSATKRQRILTSSKEKRLQMFNEVLQKKELEYAKEIEEQETKEEGEEEENDEDKINLEQSHLELEEVFGANIPHKSRSSINSISLKSEIGSVDSL